MSIKLILYNFLFISYIYTFISQNIEIEFKREKVRGNRTQFLTFLNEDIEVDFNDKYQIIAKILIGSNNQTSRVLIDTGSNILWIAGKDCIPCNGITNRFDTFNSFTYKNLSIPMTILYGTGSTKGYLGYDTIHIGNLKIEKLKFLLSYDSGKDMFSDGILGLGNNYPEDESLSLIDQLYSQKKISQRVFSQKIYPYEEKGLFSIGEIPGEIKNNNRNLTHKTYGKCDALSTNDYGKANIYWECKLNNIFFGNNINNTIPINMRINFDSGTNFLLITKYYMQKIILENYLKYYIENKVCVSLPVEGFYQVICDPSLRYNELQNLNFRFGEYVIIFKPEELFSNYGRFLQFKISASLDKGLDLWIFGEPVFRKFTVVFDKDNQEIGFFGYDVRNVGETFEEYDSWFIIIMVILSIMVIILIIMGVLFFRKKNNIEKSFFYNQFKQNKQIINSDI